MDLTELKLNQFAIAQVQGVIDGAIDPNWFESVREWQDKCCNEPKGWQLKLCALNEILGESGVESLIEDGKHIASYVNNGHTYAPTIIYDVEEGEFLVTSWGDFLEGWQAENVIEIDCDDVAQAIHAVSHSPYIEWAECNENDPNDYDSDEDYLEDSYVDIRLQVYEDGQWAIRSGLSDFDQDHRGAWGSSSVGCRISMEDAKELAKDLIEQAAEAADYSFTKTVRAYNND